MPPPVIPLSTASVTFCYTATTALPLPNAATAKGEVHTIFDAYQGTTQGVTVVETSPSDCRPDQCPK